jgi:predicted outer membrane lipoprotein
LIFQLVGLIGLILVLVSFISKNFFTIQWILGLTLLAVAFACESALLVEKGMKKRKRARKGRST